MLAGLDAACPAPKVHSDVLKIMEYYERVASADLADGFYRELRRFMQSAAENPESFSIRERYLRRVNMHRFPYHFLFRIAGDTVRILGRPASPKASHIRHSSPINASTEHSVWTLTARMHFPAIRR